MKIDKIKKKIRKEAEDLYEVDEDSDIIVHEKRAKYKRFKELK